MLLNYFVDYEEHNEMNDVDERYHPKRVPCIHSVLGEYLTVSKICKLDDITTEIRQRGEKNNKDYKIKINKQD